MNLFPHGWIGVPMHQAFLGFDIVLQSLHIVDQGPLYKLVSWYLPCDIQSLTIPHASIQHRPRISPALYVIIVSFLNSSDMPEWYHTMRSRACTGSQLRRKSAIFSASNHELQYMRNWQIFHLTHSTSSIIGFSGTRNARLWQVWIGRFIEHTQKWIFGLSFECW